MENTDREKRRLQEERVAAEIEHKAMLKALAVEFEGKRRAAEIEAQVSFIIHSTWILKPANRNPGFLR